MRRIPLGYRVLAVLLTRAAAVGAHAFDPAILDIRERVSGLYDVVWKPPAAAGPLTPRFPPPCRVQPRSGTEAAPGPLLSQVDCRPSDLHGQPITIEGLVPTRIDTVIRIAWRDAPLVTGVARATDDTFVVPGVAAGVPPIEVLQRYGRLGIEHILGGSDHLLFVLAMLLLVERFGALVRTITAFTLAHSVTLACAVVGILQIPAAPVEVSIALSIVLLATELARPPTAAPTLTRRRPWLVAFGFGLLHGLGFAGALREVGLPPDQVPLALAAFNGGVEVGQLGFVVAMALPVFLWRRVDRAPWRLVPAYVIGTVAMAWTIERLTALLR